MNVSVPAVLLGLGWKCLLNWALVFLQRRHIGRSFVGCFSVSLSLIDTALTLLFITIHLHSHGDDDDDDEGPPLLLLADLQLTTYHTCLLVQILGQVHSVLQWPVVVLTGLDHFCSVCLLPPSSSSSSSSSSSWATWIIHSLVTVLLWFLAVLYVFLLSDFSPVMEDVSHQEIHRCWVFHTSEILQVVTLLLLTLGCAALHDVCNAKRLEKDQTSPPDQDQSSRSRAPSSNRRGGVVCQVLCIFLDTWAFLLIFLAVLLLLLPVGIPSYLGLNAAWLCFLNSSLIAVVLCVACPDARLAQQGLAAVPPDSFCEWRFKFSLAAAEETT